MIPAVVSPGSTSAFMSSFRESATTTLQSSWRSQVSSLETRAKLKFSRLHSISPAPVHRKDSVSRPDNTFFPAAG